MDQKISIPFSVEIIYEMLLRSGPKTDISTWIENVVMDYLERTEHNEGWQDAYYEYLDRQTGIADFREKFGDANKGYRWQSVDLPNGTQLDMEYKKKKYYASVQFEKVIYEGKSFSPAQLVRKIADGTTRNAWRDIYVKKPGDKEWTLADVLRNISSN